MINFLVRDRDVIFIYLSEVPNNRQYAHVLFPSLLSST